MVRSNNKGGEDGGIRVMKGKCAKVMCMCDRCGNIKLTCAGNKCFCGGGFFSLASAQFFLYAATARPLTL